MLNKIKKIQIARHLVQIISAFLFPGLYVLAFSELKTVHTMITSGNFNFISAFPSLIELITVIFTTIILGRFFCGWICTFGAYNDLIHYISKKVFKVKFKINPKVDAILKYTKYLILVFIAAISWTIGSTILEGTSPWDAFAQITDISNVLSTLTIGFILLLLITVGAFFIERFFCRYLCPLGAIFTIISKISIFKFNKPNDKCGKCMACTTNCSMGLPLSEVNSVRGGECINCFNCLEVCPRNNTQANLLGQDVNPALASSIAIAGLVGVYALNNVGGTVLTNAGLASDSSISSISSTTATSKYKDGTYTGSATGFKRGTTKVSVTIKNGVITNITTVSNGDTPSYYSRVEIKIFNEILSDQSTSVDTISGATFSCNGIINAVKAALTTAETAASASTSSSTTSSSDNSTSTSKTDTTTDTTTKNNDTTTSTTENNDTTTSNNNTTTNNTDTSTTTSSTDQTQYKDGTYTGSATGFKRGITKLSVTVTNGNIASIVTISNGDTPQYYDNTESTIFDEILSAQSTSVDTISGATYTSKGIINAVKAALEQAK